MYPTTCAGENSPIFSVFRTGWVQELADHQSIIPALVLGFANTVTYCSQFRGGKPKSRPTVVRWQAEACPTTAKSVCSWWGMPIAGNRSLTVAARKHIAEQDIQVPNVKIGISTGRVNAL
jgi:hypothetical protein